MADTSIDTEKYVRKIKQRAGPTGEILQKIKDAKATELENLVIDTEIAKYKKQLGETGGVIQQPPITSLFAGRSPKEIQEILQGLSEEDTQKLKILTQNLNGNQIATLLPLIKKPDSNIKDTIALISAMQPKQQSMTDLVQAIAILMKTLKDSESQQKQGMNPSDIYKMMYDFTNPLYKALNAKDREIYDAKLKEMEAKMPGPLEDQIEYVKSMAGVLGLNSGGKSELDLRLEEMKQSREIDMKKLEWEQRKWEMEAENDARKWEQIGKVLQGPVGDVIKNVGSAGADRVRRGGNPNPKPAGNAPKPMQIQCPNCGKPTYVDVEADSAICGQCVPLDTIIAGDFLDIHDAEVGGDVIGISGHNQILSVFKRPYNDEIYQITPSGMLPIELTPEHLILIREANDARIRVALDEQKWKLPSELREKHGHGDGDYVIVPKLPRSFNKESVDLSMFSNKRGKAVALGKGYTLKYQLNNETAWLLGLYVAEGSSSKDGHLRFSLGSHETTLIEKTCKTIENMGYSPSISVKKRGTSVINLCSRILARAFPMWCGVGAKNKKVPEFILYNTNDEIVQSFIDGYNDGDGSKDKIQKKHPEWRRMCTISKKLALQLQALYARFNRHMCITIGKSAEVIEGRAVNTSKRYSLRCFGNGTAQSARFTNDTMIVPIRHVSKIHYEGILFNLQTESETYTANNIIVHNCGAVLQKQDSGQQQPPPAPSPTHVEEPAPPEEITEEIVEEEVTEEEVAEE